MDRTLNVSLGMSVGLHIGLFGFYIYTITMGPKTATKIISNVDLLIPSPAHKEMTVPAARPQPPSTWNFLKMALPQLPTVREMQVKIPEVQRQVKMPELLQEKSGRLDSKMDMQMALSKKSMALAEAAAKDMTHRSNVPMAASLQLEEVGAHRVPTLPSDLTMENSNLPAFKPNSIQEVKSFVAQQRTRPVETAPLQEASGSVPSSRSGLGKIADMLSAPSLQLQGQQQPSGFVRPKVEPAFPTLPQKRATLDVTVKSKPVEIAGPLSHRKVLKAHVPPFPRWARDRGILEAAVSIRFFVSRDGRVLPNMTVERGSGYGTLDRLAMDALKNWVFAPADSDREWGVITFKFVLE
ncbi:MAG: TonB family protein [Elusimicrobia bacterium]|nr:TonB family protein [Elusimicrobiota bacterium]